MSDSKVITRFPPSPTGFLHIGRARTALFNFVFAKQNSGKFIFRLEDTDRARSKVEYEKDIVDSLNWLGIKWSNDVVEKQSNRNEIYKKYLKKIIDQGDAYFSKEEVVEEGGREEVIRFKNPNKKITFQDLIRGEVTFDTTDLGDFVIAKSLEEPVYHLAVVVDDFEMGVTHVIRGEDGISNAPRQILIQEAIGAKRPIYAHIPLILAKDRSKLSGRHGAVGVTEYREMGYLPEAVINYLALLGWNPGTEQEIMSLDEIIEKFKLEKVQKGGAIFDEEKLKWFNKEYLKKMSPDERKERYKEELKKINIGDLSEGLLNKLEPIITERINKFGDIKEMVSNGDLQFFFKEPSYEKNNFLWKGKGDFKKSSEILRQCIQLLSGLNSEDFSSEKVKEAIWPFAEATGRGDVLWPLRYSLSGKAILLLLLFR
jgi:glutamyl-tRNA synthetase